MNTIKKLILLTIVFITALVAVPQIQGKVEATVKISSTSKTMYKGYTYNLKVTGTNKKVEWSSSDKSKATVNSKGKVYVKKNGKVTITAKVDGKKYNCKVTIKNKPYKLTQFSTTFYDLKDVAIKHKYIGSIKNYGEYKYDLNGDGKKDTILVKKIFKYDQYGNVENVYYTINCNGNEVTKVDFFTDLYVVDIDKSDKTMEVVLEYTYEGDSIERHYEVYQMQGKKIKKLLGKHYAGDTMKLNQKGKIVVRNDVDSVISPYIVDEYHELNKGKIKTIKTLVKNISKINFKTIFGEESYGLNIYFTNSKKNISTGNGKYLKKGTKFKILGSAYEKNGISYRYVKLSNGTKGYLCVSRGL